MGFYVPTNRDVKFPKACEQCHFYDGLLCCVMDTYVHDPENKHEECPLIEIPDNHGRLIDEKDICDKIRPLIENPYCYNRLQVISETLGNCLQIVRDAQTIIPADEMI